MDRIIGTEYCLGNGEIGCDHCVQPKNWAVLNKMPDSWRLEKQKTMKRIDDTMCIINDRKNFISDNNQRNRP